MKEWVYLGEDDRSARSSTTSRFPDDLDEPKNGAPS
jgi:hypothetical protein